MSDTLFVVNTIDEMVTAVSLVTDEDKVYMTGRQFKETALHLMELGRDVALCHQLCSDIGAPDLGGGTEGVVKRLEFLKNRFSGEPDKVPT